MVFRVFEVVVFVDIFEVVLDVDIFLKFDWNRIVRIILLKNVILLYVIFNVYIICNDIGWVREKEKDKDEKGKKCLL